VKFTKFFIVVLIIVINVSITDAQANIGGLLLRQSSDGLEIVTVSETGEVLSVARTLADYAIAPDSEASWILHPDYLIPTPQNITLSPDGTTVAFVVIQNEENFRLIVYQHDIDRLLVNDIPAYAYPTWSPDGESLLLDMANASNTTIYESMIYMPDFGFDILTEQEAHAIANTFQWLPDENQIIYMKNRDIFLTDSQGSFHRQLTTIEDAILLEITPSICEMVASSERIYFTVGCADDTEYLYSVDLDGNVRLELSLVDLYSDGYMPFFVPMRIAGIFPDAVSTDVFLLLEVQTANPENSSQDTTHAVHRLTAPQTTELIFERTYSVDDAIAISVVSLSPGQDYLAFAGGSSLTEGSFVLTVINPEDGTIIFEQNGLQGICELDWLSETVLAYEEISRLNCFAERFASNIYTVNLVDGQENLLSDSISLLATSLRYFE